MREVNSLFQDIKKEKKKNYKPISRILFLPRQAGTDCYHLSATTFARCLYLPTLGHRASSPQSTVYMAFQHARFTRTNSYLPAPWALTPHFHPYLPKQTVIFCGTCCSRFAPGPTR